MQVPLKLITPQVRGLFLALAICALGSCGSKTVRPVVASAPRHGKLADDNSFLDLLPGGKLRIVIPLFSSGGYKAEFDAAQVQNNTIQLKANNLIGYDAVRYAIVGQSDGRVRIRLVSAERTRDGRTKALASAPELPFSLPRKLEHIRLIYLTRSSQADHNMAIAASISLNALDRFTDGLKANPSMCFESTDVFCTWVPVGVAVRPE